VIMVLPPGGFLTLGFILLGLGVYEERKAQRARKAELIGAAGRTS